MLFTSQDTLLLFPRVGEETVEKHVDWRPTWNDHNSLCCNNRVLSVFIDLVCLEDMKTERAAC